MGTLVFCWWEYEMNGAATVKTVWQLLSKLNRLPWPSIPFLRIHPKELQTETQNKYLYRNIHSSTIHNSQKLGTIQVHQWYDDMINKMIYTLIKGMKYDTCYNVVNFKNILLSEGSQTQNPHIVWFHLYELPKLNPQRQKANGVC